MSVPAPAAAAEDPQARPRQASLPHHNPTAQNLARWFKAPSVEGWFAFHPHDPSRLEVSLRVCLITIFAISLSVAHLPKLVPPSLRFLIGAAAPVIGMIVPMLLFTLAGVLPAIFFSFLVSLAGATMLLAAATVSDGLFCGIFTIYTVYLCGLFFGKDYDKTAGNANLFIAFAGLISLSFKALIQADNGVDPADLWKEQGLDNPLAIVRNLLICFCWAFACIVVVIVAVPPLRTARDMMSQGIIPAVLMAAVSILESHEKTDTEPNDEEEGKEKDYSISKKVAPDDDNDETGDKTENNPPSYSVRDEELVQRQKTKMLHMWNATQGGGAAKMILFEPRLFSAPFEASLVPALTELLVVTSKVCMIIYGLLERVHVEAKARLLRDSPGLKQWKMILRSCAEALLNSSSDGLDALVTKEATKETQKPSTDDRTSFLAPDKPISATVSLGDEEETNTKQRISVNKKERKTNDEPDSTSGGFFSQVASVFSGQFFSSNKSHQGVETKEPPAKENVPEEVASEDGEEISVDDVNEDEPRASLSLDDSLVRSGQQVLHATIAWLEAINHPQASFKEGGTNLLQTMVLWVVAPILATVKRMGQLIVLPLHPSRFELKSVLWSLELSAGFVALFVMTVYWEGYSSFAIETGAHQVGGVFSGWQLSAYAFSWTPTAEGTFKKGILRMIGAASGGFAAWLGVIITSGSYDNSPDINPYGLVTYLTILSTIAAYIGHGGGLLAFMGAHHDYGAGTKYFVSDMCLIALEIYEEKGSRDELTVNRIIAICAGVAMAMIIAAIPPNARGGDSKWARDYATALKEALIDMIQKVLEKDDYLTTDEYAKAFCLEASEKRKTAFFVLKDASTLHQLPFYQVNPALKPILEGLAMQETILRMLLPLVNVHYLTKIRQGGEREGEAKLEALLSQLQQDQNDTEESITEQKKDDQLVNDFLSGENVDATLFNVETARIVGHRILRFERELGQLPQ